MNEIAIDISQVPPEKRIDPLFLFNLADVKKKLSNPDEVKAICVHEAAHLFYMVKAGMRDPEFSGPKIVYNPKTGNYDRYAAAVRCPNRDNEHLSKVTVGQWVFQLAKAHAAGGVAARVIMKRSAMDSGDSEDLDNFKSAYALICAHAPGQTIDVDEVWAEALRILELELQENARKDLILSMADTIKPELFKS